MNIETRRSVPEWVGKTPDSKVPDRVKLRVFERHRGICHISGRKIMPGDRWEMEHIIPLRDRGEHREFNLAPALISPHKEKTAAEAKQRAYDDRVTKFHYGMRASKNPLPGGRNSRFKKKIGGEVVLREDET